MPQVTCAYGSVFDYETYGVPGEVALRSRTTSAKATLHNLKSKGKAEPPLCFFSPDTGSFDIMEGFDKGHLIANQFINENASVNIVPMYSSFNQKCGLWNDIEATITKAVEEGHKIELTVEIEYVGPDPRIPTAFVVTAQSLANNLYLMHKGIALNKMRLAHLPLAAVHLGIDQIRAQVGDDVASHVHLSTLVSTYFEFKAENLPAFDYRIQKHNGGGLAPENEVPRPYGFLDDLWLNSPDHAVKKYMGREIWMGGKDFSLRQKALIRMINRLRNDGYLRSDFPGDTKENLIEGSGNGAAQVDHVWPQDKYGPNLFSNALIASGKFNNTAKTMEAVKKYTQHSV